MTLLDVQGVEIRHGLLRAVRDLSMQVADGETVALVGANGAGKSSLLRGIAGSYRPTSGTIKFDGDDVTHLPAFTRLRRGIALVPEGRRLFKEMTVEENLLVARSDARRGRWNVDSVIDAFPLLAKLRKRIAGNLSGGEQQAVAIGRALMTNPRLLLLDEVSLGLAPVVVDDVYRSLEVVLSSGTAVVVVEQDIKRALTVASRVICMLEGRIVLTGTTQEVTQDQVTDAYFGLSRSTNRGHAPDSAGGNG